MATRRILLYLWEHFGAPKLDACVPKMPGPRPRNVTATREEIEAIYSLASPSLLLWLLICSDLGIRSGTASKLAPSNYDPQRGEIRFITKYQSAQTLPITQEIRDVFQCCDLSDPTPFVWQLRMKEPKKQGPTPGLHNASALWRELRLIEHRLGMTKRIIPHDLRRTTAVAVFTETKDIRVVQSLLGHRNLRSTLWYLDHDMTPVNRSTLEIVKRTAWRKEPAA